jgi:hypothetical protein
VVVAYLKQERAVFLYAFAKNERENIGPVELEELRQLGSNWLHSSSQKISEAIEAGALQEVDYGE